jgi:single-stranded-DNA-specific exonuclease
MARMRWRVKPPPPSGFADELGLQPFQARMFYNRGVRSREEAEAFTGSGASEWNDPELLPDMAEGVERLAAALGSGETIGIFGDFDADGVTGTALLAIALRELGGQVHTYIPDRAAEGHGLNPDAVRELAGKSVTLLITVDCGATSVEEIDLASSLGVDTIVTDHHTMTTGMPNARAVINCRRADSRYPFDGLTGAGTALKLAEALYRRLGRPYPEHLLELAALGTVADVGPLQGENRYIVKQGIKRINATANPGIRALAEAADIRLGSIDSQSLSFGLIPRINSAGRIAHADVSLALLTAPSPLRARHVARQLDEMNTERRSITESAMRAARRQVADRSDVEDPPHLIWVANEAWIPGVLGLIAGRLADQHYRPAVAVSVGREVSRASARSISEFDVVSALAESGAPFVKFGGHPQAAGFTIATSQLGALEASLTERARVRLDGLDLAPTIEVDCESGFEDATGDGFEFIRSLSPFGAGNPAPVLLTRGARAVEARRVGSGGRHLKMLLEQGGVTLDAIAFGQGEMLDSVWRGLDLVYRPELDTWGYRPKIQLNVLDMRPAE